MRERPLGEAVALRLGRPASGARIHAGDSTERTARFLGAPAFAYGREIGVEPGASRRDPLSRRWLLAHELTHAAEAAQGPPALRRGPPWDYVDTRRELASDAAIPSHLNYELQDHHLMAHTRRSSDIAAVVDMLDVLALYARTAIDRAALSASFAQARDGHAEGDRVAIDVTPFLPQPIRSFLENLEAYYAGWRAHVRDRGTFESIFERMPDDTEERREAVSRWYQGAPTRADEWASICHQFAMISVSGTASGTAPGRLPANPLAADDEPVRQAMLSSIEGRGPYREVPRRQVQVGDFAVFRAGRAVSGLPTRIIHSGVVIRVDGDSVELLEKQNPDRPMATRTVRAILDHYRSDAATVHFLTPALAGMPFSSPSDVGAAPPTEAFRSEPGTRGAESRFVLFHLNATVLRPHEDRKLFDVLARTTTRADVTAHGYASRDGAESYNLNLSAHRAVTVKNALLPELPTGSTAEAVAHGETDAFGAAEQNRRVGIEVVATAPAAGSPAGNSTETETRE